MVKAFICFLLLINVAASGLKAQDTFNLNIQIKDQPHLELAKQIKYQTELFDSLLVQVELQKIVQQLQLIGYLEVNFSEPEFQQKNVIADLHLGPQYTWAHIKNGNIDAAILSQVKFKEENFTDRTFNFLQLQRLSERIITYFENNGYPFAAISLKNISIDSNKVGAELYLQKNQLYLIDTIIIHGDPKISKSFLENYLDVKPGDYYNESIISNISRRIIELPYLSETRAPAIQFVDGKVRLNLFLQSTPSSRFNFLLGVLPNSSQLGGKLLITGEANLALVNPFGTGKSFFVDWRGIKPRSPELNAKFIYPYFLSLPLGIDGRINIFKNDTFYTDLIKEAGVQYLFLGNNYLRAFIKNRTTNLNYIDTSRIKATKSLPQRLDISNTFYGLEYHQENLDYRFNPRKGYTFTINGSAGIKTIKRNPTITGLKDPSDSSFNFNRLYDSLGNDPLNYQILYNLANFFPLGRRATLLAGVSGGILINQHLFENELFRLGGTANLRGFDEASLRASFYNIVKRSS